MSLPALNWRYVGNQAFGTATVAACLDALFTLGTRTTYADGSPRTPGVGSAGTYSRYQNLGVTEAVYCTPPLVTALASRLIWAGYTGVSPVPAPTMASPDVAAADILFCSMNKNSGAFSAWNAASPFTSGQFFGYWRAWPTSAGIGSVDLYESTESAWVVIRNSTGAATYHMQNGALLDPESTAALDAESDGRLYGVSVTGSNLPANPATFTNYNAPSQNPMNHSSLSAQQHSAVFAPGAGTLLTCRVNLTHGQTGQSTTYLRTRSGRYARIPSPVVNSSASAPNDNSLGTFRGVAFFSNAILGQRQVDGGTIIGYTVTGQSTATNSCYLLLYA